MVLQDGRWPSLELLHTSIEHGHVVANTVVTHSSGVPGGMGSCGLCYCGLGRSSAATAVERAPGTCGKVSGCKE